MHNPSSRAARSISAGAAGFLVGGTDGLAVVRLREYYQDPEAPHAHGVLPAVFAAVRAPTGEVLLVRRIDDGYWELPGGRIEVGETITQTVVREVAEESGITIEPSGLSGIYSDPSHVLVDRDGTVHQQLAICLHAVPAAQAHSGHPRPDGIETSAAAWFSATEAQELSMHPAMRLRLRHALTAPQHPYFDESTGPK